MNNLIGILISIDSTKNYLYHFQCITCDIDVKSAKSLINDFHITAAVYNMGFPSERHLKLKSREVPFAHNSCWIVLKFCSEYGSDTEVLNAKWTTETDVMDERHFARFEFKMSFERISYIAQHSWTLVLVEFPLNGTDIIVTRDIVPEFHAGEIDAGRL